jgi:hypothetical protein
VFSTALTLYVVPAFYQLLARNTGSPQERSKKLEKLELEITKEI